MNITILIAIAAGILIGCLLSLFSIKKMINKVLKKKESRMSALLSGVKKKLFGAGDINEYTKKMLDVIIRHSILWVYLCFILAFLGKDSVLETLGSQIVSSILGGFVAIACKSAVENVFKYTVYPVMMKKYGVDQHNEEGDGEP